jgi:sugar-specific transcriptional regulator TrmB
VAKFGKMSPFVEISWNDEKWKSQVSSGGHTSAVWNEGHVFESNDAAPLTLKVLHSGLLFTQQVIGETVISTEELFSGKNKEWLDLYFEGEGAGKLLLSACMYEERRSDQSTHTTSYAAVNLKEEYSRKLNELELEKEELEFYKKKYKRKLEKLNQEKRSYQNKVKEIVKKATPKHTEETSSDDLADISSPAIRIITPEDQSDEVFASWKDSYSQVRDLVETDLAHLKRVKHKVLTSRKVVTHSQGKLSDIAKSMDIMKVPNIKKSTSEEKVNKGNIRFMADWEEVEEIKKRILKDQSFQRNEEELELKLDMGRPFTSPRRAATPKSTDMSRFNGKYKDSHFSTGKFVIYD